MRTALLLFLPLCVPASPAAQQPSAAPAPGAAQTLGLPAEADILPELAPGDRASYVAPNPVPASRDLGGAFVEGRNVRDLGALDPLEPLAAELELEERAACSGGAQVYRAGLVRSTGAEPPSFLGDDVVETELGDGRRLWTFAVRSPGALGLRVQLAGLDAETDASVLVYGWRAKGTVARGPFGGPVGARAGELWTGTIPGDTAFVEAVGRSRPDVRVTAVAHFDRSPWGDDSPLAAQGGFGMPSGVPSPCHVDPNCQNPALLAVAQGATGQMNFLSGSSAVICTGTLLADLDPDTIVPYFLSAYHCLSTQAEVASLEVVWDWRTSSCNGSLPDWFTLPRSFGQQLLATSPTSGGTDMAFMRLVDVPPGQAFAGTSTSDFPTTAWGISHPKGSWQRYVLMEDGFSAGCLDIDADDYHFGDILYGMTDKGSSGSAVFNQNVQVLGQLFGVCGTDMPTCDNKDDFSLVYGEMQESWALISYWMTLGGTIHVLANNPFPTFLQDGTAATPFATLTQAYALAWDGARIEIAGGSYDESLLMSKQLELSSVNGSAVIGL